MSRRSEGGVIVCLLVLGCVAFGRQGIVLHCIRFLGVGFGMGMTA